MASAWPNAQLRDVRDGNRLLAWEYPALHCQVHGYLNRKRQVVVLEGDIRDCAEFALFYRRLIEPRYELAFYDDGYTNDIKLTGATTIKEFLSAFS